MTKGEGARCGDAWSGWLGAGGPRVRVSFGKGDGESVVECRMCGYASGCRQAGEGWSERAGARVGEEAGGDEEAGGAGLVERGGEGDVVGGEEGQ